MKLLLLTLLIASSFCSLQVPQKSDFDAEQLSGKGRAAFQKLLSSNIFRVGAVGYAGLTSEEELALRDLLNEREAIGALKSLVNNGSHEGGLYGLLGLKVKNIEEFNRALERYILRGEPPMRKSSDPFLGLTIPQGKVMTQGGCLIMTEDRSTVIANIQAGHYDKLLEKNRG